MKKLLLLTISMVSILAKDYAAGTGENRTDRFTYNDSVIRVETPADPKDGFKDLFEKTETTTTGYTKAKLNPHAVSFVQEYIERFSSNLTKMKSWGKPYFDIMNTILAQHGLPTELKYLSVIESALKNCAVSWAGAVGPWQFMPQTARNLGLKVTSKVDERRDYYKSTQAAARYLTKLYGLYGDWLLVIAAYNGGPGNVNAAIRKSGSRNFWDLQYFLPAESRNHVKKFIATHYIMEGEGGVTTLTKSESDHLQLAQAQEATAAATSNNSDIETMNISGKYNSIVLAQQLQMNIAEFNRMNPNFDKSLAANGSFNLNLPEDKMLQFQANKFQILEQSIKLMLTMDGK